MNFEQYYTNQVKNPLLITHRIQRGHGVGDVFKRFFRWMVPIIKDNAKPILKNIGKKAIKTVANIANDTLQGKNFESSAKKRILQSLTPMENKKRKTIKKSIMTGGYKRKRLMKKRTSFKKKKTKIVIKKKKFRDIFS